MVNVSKLSYVIWLFLTHWMNKTKRYSFVGAICVEKPRTYIIKDLIDTSTKLVCAFS